MNRNTTPITLLCALALLTCGCGSGEDRARDAADSGESASPSRIAVLAPAVAEMLKELDMLDRVVAVGDFVQWPAEIAGLPKIGAYDSPNLERLLSLEVDLLVTTRSEAGREANRRLGELGIVVLALETETYEGVLEAIEELGITVGREERARLITRDIRRRIESVRNHAAAAGPRRVLVVVGQRPLYAAGPGSHIDELIKVAGGENVFSDAMSAYQLVSMEAALERMPEVIVDVSDNRPGAMRGREAGLWGQWDFLPAVRENRVYWVDPVRLTIPGPRLPEMAELMAKLIHPELFGPATDEDLGPMRDHEE
jgi:iron complex transport system substrate-binding protein